MKKSLVVSAVILSVSSILTRALGFGFRVFLSNKIGAEGMGLYQLSFSLYMIFLALCSSGISISVTKLISEHIAKHGKSGVSFIVRKAVFLTALIGSVLGAVMFFASGSLSLLILQDARTELSIKILSPTLPFVAISACLNGYFYAMRKISRPAVTQIIEQISKIALVAVFLAFTAPGNVELACAVTVIGLGLGEIICCVLIGLGYLLEKIRAPDKLETPPRDVTRRLLGVSIPISAGSAATSCFRMLENVLIVSKLKEYGSSHSAATGTYGILKGMVLPLLLFPSSLISAFVTTLVPEIAHANAGGDTQRSAKLISRVLQITTVLSVFIVAVFLSFSYELGTLIYHNDEVGIMLGMLSIICPFIYLEMVVVGLLHALGQQVSSLKYNLIDSALRIVLIILLIPRFGVNSFLWVMIASNLFTSLLNLRRLLKVAPVIFNVMDWFIKPSLAALGAGMLARFFYKNALHHLIPLPFAVAAGVLAAACLYFFAAFLFMRKTIITT